MSISKITALLNTLLNIKKLKRHTHTHTQREQTVNNTVTFWYTK